MTKQTTDEFKPAKLATPSPAKSRSRRKITSTSTESSPNNINNNNDSTIQTVPTNFKETSRPLKPSSSNLSSSQNSASMASVIFNDYDDVFDEIDALNPHEHEGGDLIDVSSRSAPGLSLGHSQASLAASARSGISHSSNSGFVNYSNYSSLTQSNSTTQQQHYVPTDYETLMNKTMDGSLADLLRGYNEDCGGKQQQQQQQQLSSPSMMKDALKLSNIVEMSLHDSASSQFDEEVLETAAATTTAAVLGTTTSSSHSEERASIVGGKDISQMTLEEQSQLLGRSTTSLFQEEETCEMKILSSVDWDSLRKSCICARNAMKDVEYSGQVLVKNMFLGNLTALIAQCNLYVSLDESDNDGRDDTMEKIVRLTKDTKRALRFAMACLSPRDEGGASPPKLSGDTTPKIGSDFRDDVERYRSGRRFRREMQDAAVKSETKEEDNDDNSHNRLGLHLPLVDIVLGTRPVVKGGRMSAPSMEKDQYVIQILAARILCNLVTDNPISAEIVLMDVPFGPNNSETERRMSMPFSGDPLKNTDVVLCWSDLVAATAKLGASTDPEREALAAVAAALHNLLASLETRDSLIELDNELKRRDHLKNSRTRAMRVRRGSSFVYNNVSDDESSFVKPLDAGFDAVYNRQLMNALLRNILPAHAVIMESSRSASAGRPKFHAPKTVTSQSNSFGDTSDSAMEWISLIIERMASRGLLPQMFQSAGGVRGKSVTPEQVVLTSCIRQAVDDYHSAHTPTGETGEFGRRRLSIAAKSAGVTTLSRPHPLWGRVNEEFGGGNEDDLLSGTKKKSSGNKPSKNTIFNSSAVPNLLFLANEVERMYAHAKLINSNPSQVLYDGEASCTLRVIEDIRDIIGQCVGRHNVNPSEKNKQCTIPEARSVLGRETSIITHCLFDIAKLLDSALARNSGKNARDLNLSPQEQHSVIVLIRLIGNMVYKCRHNQDILRIIPIPLTNHPNVHNSEQRVGLHVILSTTSLAPTCLSLREWCIVAIRNAVENNKANAEAVRQLEAQNAMGDTPELRRMGIQVDLDAKGKVHIKKRDGLN